MKADDDVNYPDSENNKDCVENKKENGDTLPSLSVSYFDMDAGNYEAPDY